MDPVRVQRRKPINRRTKLNIVFNENDRRSFLSGFHKRKVQRKKKAEEELKQKIKDERKRIKTLLRNSHERLKLSYQPIPEVEELLNSSANTYDYGDHSVNIVEINNDFLQKTNNYIGENKVLYEESDKSEDEVEQDSSEEIEGMELKTLKNIKKAIKKTATSEMKNSKVFQLKNKLDRLKQKKKSFHDKKKKMKSKKGKVKKRR